MEATGYVTTAERKIDWEDLKKELPPRTSKPDDSSLAPGALVFTPTSGRWVQGANWRHPKRAERARSREEKIIQSFKSRGTTDGLCGAAGKRLPTEAECESAARSGLESKR